MRPPKSNDTSGKATNNQPLGDYPGQFKSHLERQYYRPATIAEYYRCLTALNSKMTELGIGLESLDEEIGLGADCEIGPTIVPCQAQPLHGA